MTIVTGVTTALGLFTNCANPVHFDGGAVQDSSSQSTNPNDPTNPYITISQTFNFGAAQSSAAVDILIVDDNSNSMEQDQLNLAQSFGQFTSSLSAVDWQIGVTTTDVCADGDTNCNSGNFPSARGRLIGPADNYATAPFGTSYILSATTPNVSTLFSETIQRTTSGGTYLLGSGDERAIMAANETIAGHNDPTIAQGFFRDNASLAIVILSNEDERSCGNDATCHNDPGNADQYLAFEPNDFPASLTANIASTFGASKQFDVHSIIVKPNDTSCFNSENQGGSHDLGGNYGVVYAALTAMTGGVAASICDNGNGQYAKDLAAISQSILNITKPVVTLSHTPVGTPTISFVPAQPGVTISWTPGTDNVQLSGYPANTTVTVTYSYQK